MWDLADTGWQDRYRGEVCVIIDDFRGAGIRFSELLRYLDGYEVTLRRRGRMPAPFMATHIWITSSVHPRNLYNSDLIGAESIDQLLRRITEIVHVETPLY